MANDERHGSLLQMRRRAQHRGGDAAGEHGGDRDDRADRKLRHAGQAVAAGAAVGDARAEQHDEAGGERDGVALRRRRRAERARPDRRDRLAPRAGQLHREKAPMAIPTTSATCHQFLPVAATWLAT